MSAHEFQLAIAIKVSLITLFPMAMVIALALSDHFQSRKRKGPKA